MKKLISSTIIILPLLLLAILLVSGAVMSLLTHIYVEKVEFSDNQAIVLVMDDVEHPPTHNLGEDITILPLEASNRDLVYTDYDEKLVEVSEKGIITPKFYGETYITVESKENKDAKATRKVIITDTSVHALQFNDYEKDLYEGESEQLSVSIYPQEAENTAVTWSSSDDSILQVGSNGMVTALGNGQVTVTATAVDDTNGEVKATATINCHAKLKSIQFDRATIETSLAETNFPKITINPEDCDIKYEYSSSNQDIAKVDEKGHIVFEQEGIVTITVKVIDFNGFMIEDKMNFISTMGYFAGSLFNGQANIEFDQCMGSDCLPVELNPIPDENAYRLIKEVECGIDKEISSGEGQDDIIYFDHDTNTFKVKGELPEFDNFICVLVHATVYDRKTNSLNAVFDDSFYISKASTENNSKVYFADHELLENSDNLIEIGNIGEHVTLTVDNTQNWTVRIDGNTYVDVARNNNEITLTGLQVCEENDNVVIQLRIGTKSFNLKMKISAKAEFINVTCSDTSISDKGTYQTLLDLLTFAVEKGRADRQKIASPVKYKINDDDQWKEITESSVTINVATANKITFACDDIEFSFNIEKINLTDFGITPSYTRTEGGTQKLESISSVGSKENIQIKLPSNTQNTLTLTLDLDIANYLGGLGTNKDFEKLFKVELNGLEGWQIGYTAATKQIVITFKGTEFNKTISLTHGEKNISLQIVKVNIQDISFVNDIMSFDSRIDEDVHKGYQQIRVFAKHSYYDGKKVDYFKIPLKALSNIAKETKASWDTITWNFYRYVGNDSQGLLTSQLGDTVVIGDKTYKIVKVGSEYVLQDESGKTVSGKDGENNNGYIWVDIYTEQAQGYARVYFGNFGGLSESDVYNDYFGNFDERNEWTMPDRATDTKGGSFVVEPSANAYAFLKIVAGDGVDGGKNCYFNFNVLNDETLVNVFDAKGYYANSNIVLHTDLYGGKVGFGANTTNNYNPTDDVDEVAKTEDNKDKFITSYETSKLNKNLLYGNGYSVCFNARNEQLRRDTTPSKLGNSGGVSFGNVYNATIKGRNPTEKINVANQGVVFVFHNCFYCNIQHYYKSSPSGAVSGANNNGSNGGLTYFKNTVINKAIKGIQPYYSGATVYFENTVITDCMMAVCCEGTGTGEGHNFKIYFKGFNDVLNYHSCDTLAEAMPNLGFLFPMVFPSAEGLEEYAEWFGKKVPSSNNMTSQRFINSIVFLRCAGSNTKADYEIKSWDGEKYVDVNDLALALDLASVLGAHGWTYNSKVDTDGGILNENRKPTDRNMNDLFSQDRYIRLLCQYKDFKDGQFVKNLDHILWHMQRVYRINTNNDEGEKHIENLKQTLKDTKWSDGSGVDGEGNPYEPGQKPASIIALTKYLSCAIIPKKEVA